MPTKVQMTDDLLYRGRWSQHFRRLALGEVLSFTMDEIGVCHPQDGKDLREMIQSRRTSISSSARHSRPEWKVRTALRLEGDEGRIDYDNAEVDDFTIYVWYVEPGESRG